MPVIKNNIKIKVLIFLISIISLCLVTVLLTTQAFVTSTIENNIVDYDYLISMDINDLKELEFVANPNSKTIADIKISNKEHNGLINYGIVYSVDGYEESKLLPNINVYQNSSSSNDTVGNINKDEEKIVSVVIENNEKVDLKVNFKIVLGYVNGGDFITNTNDHYIYKKLYDELLYDEGNISYLLNKKEESVSGVYSSIDSDGDTFYYKNKDVYVFFANSYYKILRINGDKSIRLLYLGNDINSDDGIGNISYNNLSDDNTYVGYMYGDASKDSYELTHVNNKDSNIKKLLDSWYLENLYQYNDYISDAIYCNDRYTYEFGFDKNDTIYISNTRNVQNKYNLLCNNNDMFSINKGNKKLTYPIGTLTYDEVIMMNIKSNKQYWTMSPSRFSNNAFVYTYQDELKELQVSDKAEVKPVISLKENVLVTGEGTKEKPFIVIT